MVFQWFFAIFAISYSHNETTPMSQSKAFSPRLCGIGAFLLVCG